MEIADSPPVKVDDPQFAFFGVSAWCVVSAPTFIEGGGQLIALRSENRIVLHKIYVAVNRTISSNRRSTPTQSPAKSTV